MRPASKSDVTESDAAAGDFLRRLSVADAKVLLERTRKEKDAKTMEMQKMIGVRYRDLIDSADKIVTMHSAAMRLETSLKEMPDKWKEMETTLVATLSKSEALLTQASQSRAHAHDVGDSAAALSASVHERVLFIVTAHEKLWFHLDRGESDQALALYHRAKSNYDSREVQESIATYPFLPSMWASVHSFEQRVKAAAETCLTARGKDALFYAGNLSAIAELDNTHGPDELAAKFLRSRTRWLQLDRPGKSEENDSPAQALARNERQMRLNLRSLLLTILHAQDIFLPSSVPSVAQQCGLRCSDKLTDLETVRRTMEVMKEWFAQRIEEVSSHASSTIKEIPTIAKIAQTQAKLAAIESLHDAYRFTSLWGSLQSENHTVGTTSMFELLFGSSLRKRTRDLVQHSFVDATTAIKGEIRASLSGLSESTKPVRQLPNVKFYEHFDAIHKKVEGLKSSELQRVLAEEYMRTLVGVVNFLETEYSWCPSSDGPSIGASNPSSLLCLANILVSIVSQFPGRKTTIFGDQEISTTRTPSMFEDQKVFDKYAQDNKLSQKTLQVLFKEVSTYPTGGSTFMDEEMTHLDAIGFFTFRLLSQTKLASPFESVFVSVLQGLAQKYCEAWARVLLGQKIAPLRDFLHAEQYDMTNDEWIACHQGWSEHVILEDEMSADDGDASEDGLTAAGEKVWLPWCETPTVSSFLFSCCYALDEAYRLVRTASGMPASHGDAMHDLIRSVLTEQLTIMSVDVYEEAVDLVVQAKQLQGRAVLNFGEFCMLQFLFDMYFVRATLGFSDFVRFGWGDEIDLATCAPSVARLKKLFERMHDFVDPVDWEIYGPQLIENVVVQFRKSRLLFSSLSEANDISEINGKPIVVSAQDTRPIIKLVEPVPRFSLLPVPTTARRRAPSASQLAAASNGGRSSFGNGEQLFHETSAASLPQSSLKLQDYLASSNLLSAATSGTNLLSSAAKGMSFLSSATSSYLREGGTSTTNGNASDSSRSRYF